MARNQEIIEQLNELCREYDDIGETFIDVVIDAREDEGLPPLTPKELVEVQKRCDENADKAIAVESKIHELQNEYFILTGKYPVMAGDMIRSFREPFSWESKT